MWRIILLSLLLVPCAASQAPADGTNAPASTWEAAASEQDQQATLGLDHRLLLAIYSQDDPVTAAVLRAADWTSTRVFLSAVPASAIVAATSGQDWSDLGPTYRLALSQVGTTAIVLAGKQGIKRARPFAAGIGIDSRSRAHHTDRPSFSLPSGHAAIAFSMATSMSLSYPEWYVIAPATSWAVLVALSRPWLGVHYPSDILVGAALGTGVAMLVHVLGDTITPPSLRSSSGTPAAAVPLVVITF